MKGPLRWPGGKGKMANRLLRYIPYHTVYVEPFGGGASLLFAKVVPKMNWYLEVYNDIHQGAVSLFRVLRDEAKFKIFLRKVYFTLHSRVEYHYCRDTWESCEDEVEMAYRFYVASRQGFPGRNHSKTGWAYDKKFKGIRWLSAVTKLPEIHERMLDVQVDCLDYKLILEKYDSPTTFFYCDPPYVGSEGSYGMQFNHEELLLHITRLQGKVMLSNYRNDLYNILDEVGWVSIDVANSAYSKHVNVAYRRSETIWMNYEKTN